MLTALIVSQVISWGVVLALVVAVLALARQVGVLHMRVAPAGALTTAGGPSVGARSAAIPARTLEGAAVTVGGAAPGSALRLLMFVSAACPLCKGLIPMAKSFARDERVQLIFVGDDDPAVQRGMIEQHGLGSYQFINGPDVGQAFEVGKLPYAVLLDADGTVLSKGLVNSREHLESLVIAHEMGVRSVQDYIGSLKAEVA
ncbi:MULTISPECIES: methylamine utilization protein MauD [unclassified Novosphingobium]|jgi:methylamine dehydrogenase accessory protein MauD|uniref:methylamine utilization protein MauD n=1 Tax=unclassified Novosphingobium TaxID=2644732 RepID=UPI00061CC475|nr:MULTISPECIES: methylamine utilization protein MauD [unclassified Novosphingobium]MBF5090142.1 methylamine utilization protein MauD [Novosphingobium sp. NBM11]RQW45180.1 methylamine utilization protein MauD [Novosphingobium sp. LASN5T]GAO54108.1 methylamine utilization protein mauD [Novosphingobium sp. MD-1]